MNHTLKMGNERILLLDVLLPLLGIILSIVCVIALWITWWILPRWRSLHNYINVQHITMGTLHMICICLMEDDGERTLFMILTSGIIFLITMGWSLASSLLAYFKLVLFYNMKISNEKLLITQFVYGLTITIKVIKFVTSDLLDIEHEALDLYPLFLILMLKIALFVSVIISVLSCCKKSMSQRKFGHVVALVGAALICDAGTIVGIFLIAFFDDDVMNAWFYNRMIPQAALVLLNPSSRGHWRWYVNRRRRMNVVV